jgi:hypothetical protein
MTMGENESSSRLDEPRWVVVHRFFTHGGVTLYVNGASLQDLFTLIKSHGWYMPDTDDQRIEDRDTNEREMVKFFGGCYGEQETGSNEHAMILYGGSYEGPALREEAYFAYCQRQYTMFVAKWESFIA